MINNEVAARQQLAANIHALAIGDPSLGTEGAIKQYSRALTTCQWFFNADHSYLVQRQWGYLARLQASACTILVNYQRGQGLTAEAQSTISQCQSYADDLHALQITSTVPANTVIDTRTGLVWLYTSLVSASCRTLYANPGSSWATPVWGCTIP